MQKRNCLILLEAPVGSPLSNQQEDSTNAKLSLERDCLLVIEQLPEVPSVHQRDRVHLMPVDIVKVYFVSVTPVWLNSDRPRVSDTGLSIRAVLHSPSLPQRHLAMFGNILIVQYFE